MARSRLAHKLLAAHDHLSCQIQHGHWLTRPRVRRQFEIAPVEMSGSHVRLLQRGDSVEIHRVFPR
jgi:hypothetical protein